MNARTVSLAVLTAIVVAPAFADTRSAGGLTREEVKAEYIRARNAGELDYANEFITPSHQSRKAANASASTQDKLDALPPTASGKQTEKSPG
ncbi:MAG: DUF4148 domain-containing protein [Rubrivivax sp.]|nr:MAG: DUF4148 domain-containing protein [Rubrivivax sp.]